MCDLKELTSSISVVCGLISAICWLASVYVKARPNNKPDGNDWLSASYIDEGGNDVALTLKKQSKWNMCAAIFASITATAQAINNYLS